MRVSATFLWRFACLLSLAGCYTAKSAVERSDFQDLSPRPSESKVRVATPSDASDYPGSGTLVAEAVRTAALTRFANVQILEVSDRAVCERRCAEDGAHVLIIPEIAQWEDHATNWSGLADKVRITVTLYDIADSRLRRMTFTAHSTWWTFTNDPPEDLLGRTFQEGVVSLLPPVGGRAPGP